MAASNTTHLMLPRSGRIARTLNLVRGIMLTECSCRPDEAVLRGTMVLTACGGAGPSRAATRRAGGRAAQLVTRIAFVLALAAGWAVPSAALGDTVEIFPVADNTLYEVPGGLLSNGA